MYSYLTKHYNHQQKATQGTMSTCLIVLLALLFSTCAPDAFAATDINSLCDVAGWSAPLGKALGTLAIILLGFGAILGKISWVQALTVIVGIVIFLQYKDVITLLGIADATGC